MHYILDLLNVAYDLMLIFYVEKFGQFPPVHHKWLGCPSSLITIACLSITFAADTILVGAYGRPVVCKYGRQCLMANCSITFIITPFLMARPMSYIHSEYNVAYI